MIIILQKKKKRDGKLRINLFIKYLIVLVHEVRQALGINEVILLHMLSSICQARHLKEACNMWLCGSPSIKVK